MGNKQIPPIGRPFRNEVREHELTGLFRAGANASTIETAWPLLVSNTALGGTRLWIDPRAFEVDTPPTTPTQARFGYIVSVSEEQLTTGMVTVRFLKRTTLEVNDIETQFWGNDGDARAAWLVPNMKGADVKELARATFSNTTPVIRLDRISDVWHVTWVPRWVIIKRPENASVVRCP